MRVDASSLVTWRTLTLLSAIGVAMAEVAKRAAMPTTKVEYFIETLATIRDVRNSKRDEVMRETWAYPVTDKVT
jgi:hypothetical protein